MDFSLSKEQRDIVKAAREFAQGEFTGRALEFDRSESFDLDIWRAACDLGFVGTFIAEEYGGAGLGFLEHSLITEEFWAVDPGCGQGVLSVTFGSELLQLFGSEEQKHMVLPELVEGKAIMCSCITEPEAGSDPSRAATTAVRDGDEWVINGSKMFITNGTTAKWALIFAATDPDNSDRHARHSFFLAPTDGPGFQATKLTGKLGIRASDTAEVALSNLRVPADALVGQLGQGFSQLMAFFNRTRLHICAQAVGLARGCLEESVKHLKGRMQFGQPLAGFQVNRFKVAEMATRIRASRNLYWEAAWSMDRGKVDHGLIAMAKWFSARTAVEAADEALQIHGGYGYFDEYKVQRLYRDAKILEIYEGTKEVEKIIVAGTLLG
ncbi:MAG: acyl-CoA dehydrogenase family protein [Proteobacteria bacterium]|nr:acyl-CoA dehydrogenase family protein [Pseudomonadota bacterium]MBU1451436.1 acyl-CoA dehydrogenase family protein [Pseudomonadota bacterium]MBU2467647.1 acyl-CoA dehydrogenase family protein [Pseudomonadota bacterium]MBU2517481.1 acyl-CoA dehydrogenase family protein [Pseudomonadota bacterium]